MGLTRSLLVLLVGVVSLVATMVAADPRCCTACNAGDLACFINCDPNCIPASNCVTAGQNVYQAACSSICSTTFGARLFVPEPVCRLICSSSGVNLCRTKQCLDSGCTEPKMVECMTKVASLCG
eukprot:GHVS01012375.1.p1 GENE.GHVS01012375.1~~GHVS01012375.1.p1  ORF type:complete len:124 (-),score=8.64 GHVS01012375.1:81-452(-)